MAGKQLGVDVRTLQPWRKHEIGEDQRAGPLARFRDLLPKQIVPTLADLVPESINTRTY